MVTTEQRIWLGDVFNVGRYAPDSPNYAMEQARLAFEAYLAQTKLEERIQVIDQQGFDTKGLKAALKGVIDPRPTTSEGYISGKKQLEGIFKSASDLLVEKRKSLQDKFSKFKDTRLFANNMIKAHGIAIKEDKVVAGELDDEVDIELDSLLAKAIEISKCETNAGKARDRDLFREAEAELTKGIQLYEQIKQQIDAAKNQGKQQTEQAKAAELKAFELYGGTTKAMQDMIGDPELMNLMLGVGFDKASGQKKSPKLIAMEKVFTEAAKRYDNLKKSGLTPIEAAEIAFENIPRAFWPDRAIREIDMFMRVEAQIELDEANQEAKSIGDKLSGATEDLGLINEYANLGISTTGDYVEYILKDKLGLKSNDDLPKNAKEIDELKINGQPASPEMKEFVKSQIALKDGFGIGAKATEGFGVFLKAVDCLRKTKDSIGEFEGPVQEKIAEFERNKAMFDLLIAAEKYGANLLKDVCPALGAASAGVDVVVAVVQAAKYFKMLSDINALGEKAERDPKSVVYLPLIRMAKHERIKAAEQVMKFVESALAVAGKSAELSGVGAMAGLAIDATSKIVAQGSKFVFANIKWSDAKKAQKYLLEVKGPPLNRALVAEVFKFSNKYATYCLAIAAVEDNDTWAIRYCLTNGLKEGEVSDPATSIMVLRKYILMKAEMSDDQETFGDTLVGKAGTFAAEKLEQMKDFIGDKIVGRDTSAEYQPPTTFDPETGTYVPNDNYKDLPEPELDRNNWQQAKLIAIQTGWYDDRSGLGEELDRYKLALQGWEIFKSSKPNYLQEKLADTDLVPVETFYTVLRDLESFLKSLKPLANDRKQTHEGMSRYLNGLLRKLSDVYFEVDESRSLMINNAGDLTTDEQVAEAMQKAVKLQLEENDARLKAFDAALGKIISEQQWETPLGPSKLADYEALVCSKLGISSSLINGQISSATEELKADLIAEAGDFLGAYQPEQLGGVFKTVYDNPLKKIAYDAFAKLGVRARQLRDFAVGTASTVPDSLTTGLALNQNAVDLWNRAVEEAVGYGMQKTGTADVASEFKGFVTEIARYESSGIFHYKANAQDWLRKLQIRLKDKFSPVDADGLPFEPMEKYVRRYLALIAQKIDELDEEEQTGWKPTDLKDGDDLTAQWWKENKENAIKNLMEDKSTKIGKALEALEKARSAFTGSTPPSANDLKNYVKAISSAAKAINKFVPQTKSKKTHPGGQEMKNLMRKKLAEYQLGIESSVSYKDVAQLKPQTITTEEWKANKQKFIDHGLVDESTGIGNAIKAFDKAKGKFDKATNKNRDKLKQEYIEAGGRLITTAINTKPVDILGKPFKPAEDYLKELVSLVDSRKPT